LKIFFLIHDDYAAGGLQRSTVAAADCLTKAGHEVTIYCVKALDGGLAGTVDSVRTLVPEHESRFGFWLNFLRELRGTIATERPGLCIGMGLSTSILLVLATRSMRRPRLFGSERAYPPATPAAAHWKALRRFAFSRLDKIICQTRQTADWFEQELGIARDRLAVIPNIVETPVASPARLPELSAFQEMPLVACVGRLEPQKGFDMALSIFSRICEARSDARCLIIGEGPLEAELKAKAVTFGIADRVHFLPRLPDLGGLWPSTDLFLLTSRFEGIPNVLAEAMANGVACVSFDCPTGPAELIHHDEDGFLIPLGDVEAAAETCIELLGDDARRKRIGERARKISDRFSRGAICEMWNELV
jgi:glycosyltransferase involved in cell wall biosynthesis